MFEGFSEQTIDFMWNLRLNNNRPWFQEHKEEFQQVFQTPMKELAAEVFGKVTSGSDERGLIHKVSRIYRDARRNHSDGPYRCNLWFSMERPSEEWTSTPVFWFELSPENWSYGLGYYQAKPATMAKLRARIDKNPKKFGALIAPLAGQEEFALSGQDYVRAKTAPTPESAPWYNKKSFSLVHSEDVSPELFSRALADRLVEGYRFLLPLYDYFVTLDSDPAPTA